MPQPNWFAVYTRPRQEQIAMPNLMRQGFECFLPMAVNPYQRRTWKKPRVEPLFPRYMFLRAVPEEQNMAAVRSTRGVVGLVRSGFELIRVPERIIAAIQERMHPETGLVELDPAPVQAGDEVRVFDGPFTGAVGILRHRCSETRSMLLLNILGRETTVEVDSLLLQRA